MDFNIKRLTEDEFKKFAKLIYDESGIFLKDAKLTLLSNRLRKRLQALGLENFSDYYGHIEKLIGPDKKNEYEKLLDVVSTNETYFFRNERHFNALLNECLPRVAREKKSKTLRIWSAACSTGEEAYTIAICIKEIKEIFPNWDIKIIATDIAPSVLEFGKIGEYSGRRIEKVDPKYLAKYFSKSKSNSEAYIVNQELKDMVEFKYLNFFKNEFPRNIDIIFCRNVMIYFDKIHQRNLISKFYSSIETNGFLFIGHSETLHTISDDFIYNKILESPVYLPKPRG